MDFGITSIMITTREKKTIVLTNTISPTQKKDFTAFVSARRNYY